MVREVLTFVGLSTKLYDQFLVRLRSQLPKTRRDPAFCTSLPPRPCTASSCHKFTWCIAACVREQLVDAKKLGHHLARGVTFFMVLV